MKTILFEQRQIKLK